MLTANTTFINKEKVFFLQRLKTAIIMQTWQTHVINASLCCAVFLCRLTVLGSRNHMLQADSDKDLQMWISAIQAGVSKAYNRTASTNNTSSVST